VTSEEQRSDWTLGGVATESPLEERRIRQDRRGKRRFRRILLVLLLLSIILGGSLWQSVKSQSFPKLAPGMYAGTLRGPAEYGAGSDWLLTISDDFKDLRVAFLGADGTGNVAQRDSSGYLVVTLTSDQMIFEGDGSNTALSGSFRFTQSARKGSWDLQPVSLKEIPLDQQFRNWLQLRSELFKVEQDIEIADKLIPVQKAEIDELSKVISDENALKDRGDQRLADLQEKIKTTEAELIKKRTLLQQAESQLLLAQRVALRGKLVNLARESNEREARWARSILLAGGSEDLEGALQRSEEVRSLKQALVQERILVQELVQKIEKRDQSLSAEQVP